MNKFIKGAIFGMGLAVGLANCANAYEVKNVCAKYQTNYSWSPSYQVQAQIYSGQELNQATGRFNQFDFISHYAVIWWQNAQPSVIKINSPYVAGMMLFNTSGNDQQGRQWQISDNNGFCY